MAFYEAEFGRALAYGLGYLRRVADRKTDIDFRKGAAKRDQARRKPIARDGLARLDRKAAAPEPAEIRERTFGGLGACEHRAGFAQKYFPFGAEIDAPADAMKQRHAITVFERGNRRADGRLRQVQRFGGAGHMLAFGDGDEDAELLKRHPSNIDRELDQGEAEAGDEYPGGGRQSQRLQPLRPELAEIRFEPHRRQRHGEQEGGERRGDGLRGRRYVDHAVDQHQRNETEHEPRHGRRGARGRLRRMRRAARGHDAQGNYQRRQHHHARQLGDRPELTGLGAILERSAHDLRDLVDGTPGPQPERLGVEMQQRWQQRIEEHRQRTEDRHAGDGIGDVFVPRLSHRIGRNHGRGAAD